jgi:hypothetical protein
MNLFGEKNESNEKKILGFVKAVGFVYSKKKKKREKTKIK